MLKFALKPLIAALVMGTSISATAASSCKGQAQSACSNSTSCYWVEGYKRSDGAKVKAHCRAKPSKSAVKNTTEKKATKATDSKSSKGQSTSSSKTKAEDKAKSSKKKAEDKAKSSNKKSSQSSDSKKEKTTSSKSTSSKKSSDKKQ